MAPIETDSIASLSAAACEAARTGCDVIECIARLLDYLACDADRRCRYGDADQLSALATCLRALATRKGNPMASRLVWLSVLGGEARSAVPLAIPRAVFVAPPQRIMRDSMHRVTAAWPSSVGEARGSGVLVEWLYRMGAADPDYAMVRFPDSSLPEIVPHDWIRSPRNIAMLPRREARDLAERRA